MEFDNESDADLLVYMQVQDSKAMAAWGVFYKRHAPEVYRRLRHSFRKQLGDDGVVELHTLTFQKAFERAHRFEARSDDRKAQARQVIKWLCKIARNLFLNSLRQQLKMPTVPFSEDPPAAQVSEEAVSDDLIEAAREVLDNDLSDLERTVLLETATWMDTATGESNMPRGAAKALADQLGTKAVNMTQIRKRALAKFEKLVSKKVEQRSAP